MGFRTVLVALMAIAIAGPAAAQVEGPADEVGEKRGPLVAPPGGKAYRETWNGTFGGFIEVVVDRDGAARIRGSRHEDWAPLKPGDLRGFEAELAQARPADFQQANTHNCLDDCYYYFLEVVTDGQRQHGRVEEPGPVLHATNELAELAKLRLGGAFAAPGPLWTRPGLARPTPPLDDVRTKAWTALALPKLTPVELEPGIRAYRLVTIPRAGPARVVSLTMLDDRRKDDCGPRTVFCYATIDAARIVVDRGKARRASFKRARAVEDGLFMAGLSELAAASETPCPQGDAWVLEALIGERYRAVTGSACDARGLGPALEALRKLAKR
jgi:hypothetical protein